MSIYKAWSVALAAASTCLGFGQLVADYALSIQNSAYNKEDNAVAVAYDAAGNTYLTGTSQYTLGGGTRNAIWTMKLDKDGLVVWDHYGRAGLTGENDFAKGIAVDTFGNTYVAAEGNRTATDSRMLLIKYDPAGGIQWARFYVPQAGKHNVPVGVGLDSKSRPYMGGTAGQGSSTSSYSVVQYSGGGILNWHQEFDLALGQDECAGMKVLPSGDVFLAGTSDPVAGMGAATSWVVKYNNLGVKQWDNGITNDTAVIYQTHAMDVAADGSVCVTGTNYPVDAELFAARFSKTGSYQWTRTYSGGFTPNDTPGGQDAAMGPDGSVYVTGVEENTSGDGGRAIFIRWDSAGTFYYAKTFGTFGSHTIGKSIMVDAYSRVYIGFEENLNPFSSMKAGVATFNGVSGSSVAAAVYGNGSTLNHVGGINIDAKGRIYFTGTNKLVPNSANYMTERFIQPIVSMNRGLIMLKDTTLNLDAAHGVFQKARYYVDGTATLTQAPTHGSLTLNADGSLSYTPTPGYEGADTFKFKGVQRGMNGNIATVNITILHP